MKFLMLLAATLMPAVAIAAEPSELVKCSAMTDSVKRLGCYDRLAEREHAAESAKATDQLQETRSGDNWRVSIETSKIDDTTTVTLMTDALRPVPGRFSRSLATPTMILRCLENTTSMYIHFGGLFMADSGSYGEVTFRVDDKKAFDTQMYESTNHMSLGLWRGGTSIPFIKRLFGGSKLIMRATPFNESAVMTEFDIRGLEQSIEPLRKACKW